LPDFDVIHVSTPIAAALVRIASAGKVSPVVVYMCHGFHFWPGSGLRSLPWRVMEALLARRTGVIITLNQVDTLTAEASGFPHVERLSGVGIDLAQFASSPKQANNDAPHYVVIGNLERGKRPGLVLSALAEASAGTVTFVGGGDMRLELEGMAEHLGVSDRVDFVGRQKDVRPFLQAADALVFLSEREGLPRSVMEAVSMGRPVVAFNIRGVADILGGKPWWFEPLSTKPSDVAESMQRASTAEVDHVAMRASLEKFETDSVVQAHREIVLKNVGVLDSE